MSIAQRAVVLLGLISSRVDASKTSSTHYREPYDTDQPDSEGHPN